MISISKKTKWLSCLITGIALLYPEQKTLASKTDITNPINNPLYQETQTSISNKLTNLLLQEGFKEPFISTIKYELSKKISDKLPKILEFILKRVTTANIADLNAAWVKGILYDATLTPQMMVEAAKAQVTERVYDPDFDFESYVEDVVIGEKGIFNLIFIEIAVTALGNGRTIGKVKALVTALDELLTSPLDSGNKSLLDNVSTFIYEQIAPAIETAQNALNNCCVDCFLPFLNKSGSILAKLALGVLKATPSIVKLITVIIAIV